MKLKKAEGRNYLLVKLRARDKKYLEGLRKYENAKTVKNTDNYLSQMLALHINAVYVMQTAFRLEQEGIISSAVISRVFKELDRTIHSFENTVNKYFIKFSDQIESNKKKKFRKRKTPKR